MEIDTRIVRAAIHPGIGIARVGNSEDKACDHVVGPEVLHPAPIDRMRDDAGKLLRQAARFRLYGYNAADEVVAELTPGDDVQIEWRVELANTKAAWYQYQVALDIPEAATAAPSLLRNADADDRSQLAIRPAVQKISGCGHSGRDHRFDDGKFMGDPVYLGELRTDDAGRLLVLGGRGASRAIDNKPATDFANNDGWHDDTSDGPVHATLTLRGADIPVDGAWVVVAPPNYAPGQRSVRTLRDVLFDVQVRSGAVPFPAKVSFTQHVLPILERQSGLQWVNKAFAAQFGWGGPASADDDGWLAKLDAPGDTWAQVRRQVANAFRRFDRDGASPQPWPWNYGDAMTIVPTGTPRQYVALTDTQLALLDLWAEGRFESDLHPRAARPRFLADLPVPLQPAMLDEAALDDCIADAFHPGCEVTWPMRHASLYRAPYRIREAASTPDAPDRDEPRYGSRLSIDDALSPRGPLYAQQAGDLTRWMALPWQTDTASCRSAYYPGYGPHYDPYVPTFWPARVPNQVLTEADYDTVMDTRLPLAQRVDAFNRRADWTRTLGDVPFLAQINHMVKGFAHMGVVLRRNGYPKNGDFPEHLFVEHLPPAPLVPARKGHVIEPFDQKNEARLHPLRGRPARR